MKNLFKTSILPTLMAVFAVVIVGSGCPAETAILEESDTEAPKIIIVTPNDNAVFYPIGTPEAITTVVLNAGASDNVKVNSGTVKVINPAGEVVHTHSESTDEVYTSFSTDTPGTYSVIFEFVDTSGNKAELRIIIICNEVSTDGDDTAA
ncbi:hypothetical protein [Algibacter mikhailovii]|nr:hypothetical protein [Algibacter mikhailovii]